VASLKLQAAEYDIQGKSGEEEAMLYKLVSAQRQLYGAAHPNLAQSLNTLASVLRNEGKLAEAEPIRREALAMQSRLLGGENAEVAQTLSNLGELLVAENKCAEAEPFYRNSLAIRRKIFGDDSAPAADSLTDLGGLLEKENKLDDARKLYLEKAEDKSASATAAQYALGILYLHGQGVPQDVADGVKWLCQSADSGNSRAQIDLAVLYFNGTGLPPDEREALKWFQKAAAAGNLLAMKTLATCYCAAGRSGEGIATLKKAWHAHPKDMDAALTLATWQAWFGKAADYEVTRQQILKLANGTDDALTAEMAAKAYCLSPSTNGVLLTNALDLARRGVEFRKGTPWLCWYQLSLGLAEYRNNQYAEAEQILTDAEQNAGKYQEIPGTARFFHVMSLLKQGHAEAAWQIFNQSEAQMPPYPHDTNKPLLDGKMASHDVMIGWLAYQEAKSLFATTKP
jgi:TPR repeat protein